MKLKSLLKIFGLYLHYSLKLVTGRTARIGELEADPRFKELYKQLHIALRKYEPGERDYLKGVYLHREMIPPNVKDLRVEAAHWAAESLVIIEKMSRCELPPHAFKPLVHPLEIPYYAERVSTYLNWLSDDERPFMQKVPLPFFYMIAAERFSNLLKKKAFKPVLAKRPELEVLVPARELKTAASS